MRLQKDSKYHLRIEAGPHYYPYSSYIYTHNTSLRLAAAIMPVLGDSTGQENYHNPEIGIALSWSSSDPVDLDLYVFMPGPDGTAQVREQSTIYWAQPSSVSENYTITLEMSDSGQDKISGMRSYGPESMHIAGDLSFGTFAVFVHVHNPDGPDVRPIEMSLLHGGGATVSIYSSMLGGRAFSWTLAKEQHHVSDWWHVCNLNVKEDFDPTIFGAVPRKRFKKVSLHNVDKLVRPGPYVSNDGHISGYFTIPPHKLSDETWLREYQKRVTRLGVQVSDWRTAMQPRDWSMGTEFLDPSSMVAVESIEMTLARY